MNICNELRVSLFLQARVISSFHFISPFSSFFLLRGSGAPEPFFICATKKALMGRNGKLVLLRFLRQKPAPPPGTLRWARFLPDEKSGKESPKAGPSPALWNPPRGTGCPCVFLFSALGPVGSHRWLAVLWFVFPSLFLRPSTARAFPWCAAVSS